MPSACRITPRETGRVLSLSDVACHVVGKEWGCTKLDVHHMLTTKRSTPTTDHLCCLSLCI